MRAIGLRPAMSSSVRAATKRSTREPISRPRCSSRTHGSARNIAMSPARPPSAPARDRACTNAYGASSALRVSEPPRACPVPMDCPVSGSASAAAPDGAGAGDPIPRLLLSRERVELFQRRRRAVPSQSAPPA